MSAQDKVLAFAIAIDDWRRHWSTESARERVAPNKELRSIAIERRRTALACMAASMLLHDRVQYVESQKRAKIRADFEANGMILPGHRLVFVGDNRPVSIPIDFTPQA